ncbi:Fasciclin-like arabinogalactan protein 19 [Hibiscus trionum]|uniref:Fasciclin-like arabinogalactan protein 19 n=1 Tax=Hibiscus trionum TaxID=183268 RepID=A0A9W7JD55_HIBTR|nr:Fasciclin-like arabinogalactan protein 19 [Hibiscus trionum]
MEILSSNPIAAMIPIVLLLLLATTPTSGLTTKELDAALLSLRSRGYTLFPNVIETSDLKIRLLKSQNSSIFTMFAPSNSLLFSLDLLSSARLYTVSLFLHVSSHFLSSSNLIALSCPAFIDTLLPNRQLFVERTMFTRNGTVLEIVAIDRVVVSVPDLFIRSHIAVHGLDGILKYWPLVGEGSDINITIAEPPRFSCRNSPANSLGNLIGSSDILISCPLFIVAGAIIYWVRY